MDLRFSLTIKVSDESARVVTDPDQSPRPLLRSTNPLTVLGVDALGSSGGLVVASWAPFAVDVLSSMSNFVFCKISANNGMTWYILFLYGESSQQHRSIVWEHLLHLLASYPEFLIIGDINQVDHYADKLGGTPIIRGWDEFTNWKHDLQLQDIPFVGPRFTWTNNREGEDLIMERLDRAYASPTWYERYPLGYVKNLPILHSDHSAIFYQTEPPVQVNRRPYQFENWCFSHPDVLNLISSVWSMPIVGSVMYCFTKHISYFFRNHLRRWCLDHKVVWGIDWKDLSTRLDATATNICTLSQGHDFMTQRQHELDLASLGHIYWSQRSKDRYIQLGELPTKYFYNKMKSKRHSAYIYLLKNSEGQWIEDGPTILANILNHFKSAYGLNQGTTTSIQDHYKAIDLALRELNLPHLSRMQQQQLLLPFSEGEVREAMFGIGDAKSPGLDGSTAEFFKTHWTFIVLLPKCTNPEDVTQFRPISLCNTIYKCVSKCLVNRLRPLLPDLITEYQSAFIPGRHMDDNILISHELSHVLNKHHRGNVHLAALKIDMNKAYDRVNWRFLLKVLHTYGLPGYAPSISHLFFANDALLFFKASNTSCTAISNLLGRFCHISGQMISLRKSYVKFSPNIPESRVLEYKGILELDSTQFLGTYLGAPVDIQGKKTRHFTFLLDKISQRITTWSHSPLSQAAKLILINSILLASIAHILSVFLIPTTIANKVDVMLTRFSGLPALVTELLGEARTSCICPRVMVASGLHQVEKVLLTNYVWKIGSNSGLLAGKECWVNGEVPLFRDNVPLRTVASTTVASLLLPQHQGWNVPYLCALFQSSTVRTIRGLEILQFNSPSDSPIWPFTTSGQYTTKSGYFFLSRNTDICSMNFPLNSEFFRLFWGLRIMPKWKIFLWKLCHNGIATSANLSSRGLAISDTCTRCNLEPETCQHIFWICHLATILWQSGQLGIHSNSNPDIAFKDWLIAWVHYFYQQDGYNSDRLPIFVATLWGIWQGRNKHVLNEIIPDLAFLRSLVNQGIQQHFTFLAQPLSKVHALSIDSGPPGFLITHFGASFCGKP
ncbi:uncharacterized protein LOC130589908 [Beta vulgaris subsp. vulgaris]|uniref:uncharacterized protein LOC130589908 n=1 Tax=Beta vulgaris subsp. vulgaris TaxID=3555 RepID=UPI002548916A|nr:uncharacterized protein LOC130589908 [Beta vulgaris subsp. vulgaris]